VLLELDSTPATTAANAQFGSLVALTAWALFDRSSDVRLSLMFVTVPCRGAASLDAVAGLEEIPDAA